MATKTRASAREIKVEAGWILEEPNGKQFIRSLLAAERGDTVAQSSLDAALIENPRLWKIIDTVENEFAGALIKTCFPGSWLLQKAMTRRMEVMREELLGDSPSPVERLVVERICVCWLGLQSTHLKYLAAFRSKISWETACLASASTLDIQPLLHSRHTRLFN
jgi:hypothetical protein